MEEQLLNELEKSREQFLKTFERFTKTDFSEERECAAMDTETETVLALLRLLADIGCEGEISTFKDGFFILQDGDLYKKV